MKWEYALMNVEMSTVLYYIEKVTKYLDRKQIDWKIKKKENGNYSLLLKVTAKEYNDLCNNL